MARLEGLTSGPGVVTLPAGAAHLAAERRPATLEIVTLDDRLRAVAAKEGFILADVPAL